uniref:Uncharacterized protein n=1 Tax=Glossina austeni TaxID=7395 RepID=A0A1A9UN65_GLOAU
MKLQHVYFAIDILGHFIPHLTCGSLYSGNFWNVNARNSCGVKDNSKLRSKVCLISTAINESMPISESVVPNERDLRSRAPKMFIMVSIIFSLPEVPNRFSATTMLATMASGALSNERGILQCNGQVENSTDWGHIIRFFEQVAASVIGTNVTCAYQDFATMWLHVCDVTLINSASRGLPSIESKITLTDSSVRPAQLMLGAIFPVSKAKQTLTSEHIPEAGSAWPAFDLTEPTNKGVER